MKRAVSRDISGETTGLDNLKVTGWWGGERKTSLPYIWSEGGSVLKGFKQGKKRGHKAGEAPEPLFRSLDAFLKAEGSH